MTALRRFNNKDVMVFAKVFKRLAPADEYFSLTYFSLLTIQ